MIILNFKLAVQIFTVRQFFRGSKIASRLANYYPDRFTGFAFFAVGYIPPNTQLTFDQMLAFVSAYYPTWGPDQHILVLDSLNRLLEGKMVATSKPHCQPGAFMISLTLCRAFFAEPGAHAMCEKNVCLSTIGCACACVSSSSSLTLSTVLSTLAIRRHSGPRSFLPWVKLRNGLNRINKQSLVLLSRPK